MSTENFVLLTKIPSQSNFLDFWIKNCLFRGISENFQVSELLLESSI